MKFAVTKTFDRSRASASKLLSEAMEFVDWINLFADNVGRILRNGITVADNLDGEYRDVAMLTGVELAIKLPKAPTAILVARSSAPVTSLQWVVRDSVPRVTATFGEPASDVRLLILY
jgi:hypothetical protein